MVKKSWLSFVLVSVLLVFAFTGKVSAASLFFSVPTEEIHVAITDQGTMVIDYLIDFDNTRGGSVIDYVDIGLPNQSYVLSSITADVDGKTITDIEKGDPKYIATGVTLGLGPNAIQPGQKGRLHLFVGEVGNVLYDYTGNNKTGYVSFEFVPNTFGSQYVSGPTDLTFSLHFPPGVQPEEPVYFLAANGWPGVSQPDGTLDDQGFVTYTWHSAGAEVSTPYKFGGAFPSKYIPASAIVKTTTANNTTASTIIILFFVIVFIGILAVLLWAVINLLRGKPNKMNYLPPKIAVEGLGIKRGLTPVEVAVLMEQPVDKILTMILFSVIKKGAASIVNKDPLQLEITSPTPPDLHYYETNFLGAIQQVGMNNDLLRDTFINLIKNVTSSMQGFSRKETVAYYQDIITKAWAEVETAGTPEVKSQKFDETMDWTRLDNNFDTRTRKIFANTPVIAPMWWGRYDPAYRAQSLRAVASPAGSPSVSLNQPAVSMPHLPGSDFAASLINSTSDFSAKAINNVQSFTDNIARTINPPPPPPPQPAYHPETHSSSGSSWSSGSSFHSSSHSSVHISTHSGGGHHCACACAGGGR